MRRGRCELMFVCVNACNGQKITHMLYSTGTGYDTMRAYLKQAVELGLVVVFSKKGHDFYTKTKKGLKFLKGFREMLVMLGRNDLYG